MQTYNYLDYPTSRLHISIDLQHITNQVACMLYSNGNVRMENTLMQIFHMDQNMASCGRLYCWTCYYHGISLSRSYRLHTTMFTAQRQCIHTDHEYQKYTHRHADEVTKSSLTTLMVWDAVLDPTEHSLTYSTVFWHTYNITEYIINGFDHQCKYEPHLVNICTIFV